MKKLFALMLAAALALSLTACGGGTGDGSISGSGEGSTPGGGMTKEEMLEQAIECSEDTINDDTLDNMARAKQTYCGKTLLIKGQVTEISSDYITMGRVNTYIKVYLPVEDIVNLEYKQFITIVGNMGEEITEGTFAPDIPQKVYTYEVSPAYLVADTYEFTGTPIDENDSFPGAWNVEFSDVPNPEYRRLVYFDSSVDVSQYVGKEITFSAKVVSGENSNTYSNAVIVE